MLHIQLLGRFSIKARDRSVAGFEARKPQETLSYLLVHRERPQLREHLTDLLWCECEGNQARKGLRQALWHIQAAVERELPDAPPLLLADGEWLQVNPDAELWDDVRAFERAARSVEGVSGEHLTPEQFTAVEAAVALYGGDLLEGWYADWCLFERERLQNSYLALLDKLMGHCEATRQHESGLRYGAAILRYDLARERTHRRMMRLHYHEGDRTAALRQYERCVEALRRELDAPPAAQTLALYEQIRADALAPTGEPPSPPARAAAPADALAELRQLRCGLDDVQHYLDQQIACLSRARGE